MGGIGFIVVGILLSLYGFGKIQASKNAEKNAEWLSKYGKFLKILILDWPMPKPDIL